MIVASFAPHQHVQRKLVKWRLVKENVPVCNQVNIKTQQDFKPLLWEDPSLLTGKCKTNEDSFEPAQSLDESTATKGVTWSFSSVAS